MLRQALLSLLVLLLLPLAFASAQSKQELKLRAKQASALDSYAEKAYQSGFPHNAKKVWLLLLSEYDTDHANARARLGYNRSGSTWVEQPGFVYPKSDSTDAGKAASLKKKWASTSAKLALNHKRAAVGYDKAGRTDLARPHWQLVLRFAPDDSEAQAALDHEPVEGVTGTEFERELYARSQLIATAVAEEARRDHEVVLIGEGEPHPMLDAAKVPYITVKSEHFTLHGDFKLGGKWDTKLLIDAAQNAERAIRVLDRIMEGYEGFQTDPETWITDWAFFQDRETYRQVLRANSDLMTGKRLDFLVEYTTSCYLVDHPQGLRLDISAPTNAMGVNDGAVRKVARSYSGFQAPAMSEGIGHTIVGMFFNNNRSFIIDLNTQPESSAGEEDPDHLSPDMDAWKQLALEAAWKLGEGTPAARLPLITADKFPDDARIKSWSFCDYLIRRDPTFLLDLDGMRELRQPAEVEAQFTAEHDGLSLAQLEREWKDYWTGASPLLQALREGSEPLGSLNRGVTKWLKEFNKSRVEVLGGTSVTWSETYSERCAEHVRYLLLNEEQRGAVDEQRQAIDLEGGSHLGDLWAHMALVCTDAEKPRDVFRRWLDYPGYRDAMLNARLRTIGLYVEDGVLAVDVIRGIGTPEPGWGGMTFYPRNETVVPTEIQVAELGPEVRALLESHGEGGRAVLGYPLSLHQFGQGGMFGLRDSYRAVLTYRGAPVEGIIHVADGGENRRSSAPGMVVFYPLEPLQRGKQYVLKWIWETADEVHDNQITFDT